MRFKKLTRLPRQILRAIVMEGVGTGRMLHTYVRHGGRKLNLTPTHRHPSSEELRVAGEQLSDVPRSLVFIAVVLIPIPGFVGGYAVMAVAAERLMGDRIKLLPTRFRHFFTPKAPGPI